MPRKESLPSSSGPTWRVLEGDCRELLSDVPDASVRCCVTSPPYFGLRDYGHDGQIGLEASLADYVSSLVDVARGVRRALTDDGTLWLNLGDSYAGSWGAQGHRETPAVLSRNSIRNHPKRASLTGKIRDAGLKPKDLMGVPWAVAFALRDDGWYLRQEIIWGKTAPMPDSVRDRCTRSHEQLFQFAKQPRYFYNAEAIQEDSVSDHPSGNGYARDERETYRNADGTARGQEDGWTDIGGKRNRRDVWMLNPEPFSGAHFATFPTKLVEPCILAGSERGDLVLDPFAGSGTTGLVALRHGRSFVGLELNPEYAGLARRGIINDAPLLNHVAEAA